MSSVGASLVHSHPVELLASHEAEVALVGAFLVADGNNVEALDRAAALIDASMFTRRDLAAVFEAVGQIRGRREPVDSITLSEELKGAGRFEEAGGFDLLSTLVDAVPSAAHVEQHAEIVRERASRRRIRAVGRKLALAVECGDPVDEAIATTISDLRGHARGSGRFRFRTEADLDAMRPPEQLVGGILTAGSLSALVGPPEAGKSFLVLDWALCIRSGLSWIGRAVHRGPVVYVSAEGSAGLGVRVRAWKDYQQRPNGDGVHFVTEPVRLMDLSHTDRFLTDLDRQLETPPALVIFDTLARCMVGGDENSAQDMGLFIRGADRVREETGATVLLVHHTNASGERERGSTALRGAVDTLVKFVPEGSTKVLRCEKQKDMAPFDPIPLRLRPHAGSAILTPTRSLGVNGTRVTEGELETLRSLHMNALEEGLPATQWQEVANGSSSGFYGHRKSLLEKKLVERDGPHRGARYRVTASGEAALSEKLQ